MTAKTTLRSTLLSGPRGSHQRDNFSLMPTLPNVPLALKQVNILWFPNERPTSRLPNGTAVPSAGTTPRWLPASAACPDPSTVAHTGARVPGTWHGAMPRLPAAPRACCFHSRWGSEPWRCYRAHTSVPSSSFVLHTASLSADRTADHRLCLLEQERQHYEPCGVH